MLLTGIEGFDVWDSAAVAKLVHPKLQSTAVSVPDL